jgi:AraC-like DNA-binding protein
MIDPLAEIVSLLHPSAPSAKMVSGAGAWRVRRTSVTQVFYSLTLLGRAQLVVDGTPPVILGEGDFVLIPSARSFTLSSLDPEPAPRITTTPIRQSDGSFRLGDPSLPVDTERLIGHCRFASPDAAMLVTLLPDMVVVRGQDRLGVLARLIADESRAGRPARDMIVERLLEVLLIEALRSSCGTHAPPGLARGLADDRLAAALRAMHTAPDRAWTVQDLARSAGLSRSALFARFDREVGMPPMEYLIAWRMSLAKAELLSGRSTVAEVARRVGYGSASAFSVAFSRQVGLPPVRYAQMASERTSPQDVTL